MAKRYIQPGDIGAAEEAHEHDAADVSSGTLAPAQLATGTPGAGKYPDGSGAWTTLPVDTSYVSPSFKSGLRVVWVSATQIQIQSGAMYIPASSAVRANASTQTVNLSGFTANAFRYVYAYDSSGTLAFEVSTQAPETTPYHGTARRKGPDGTPDATRRFVFALLCNNGGTGVYDFSHNPQDDRVSYIDSSVLSVSTFIPFAGTTATTLRTLTVSAAPPSGVTRAAGLEVASWHGSMIAWGKTGITPSPTVGFGYLGGDGTNGTMVFAVVPLDANRQFAAKGNAAASHMEWYTQCYWFDR